jgi:hypothetical protein
VLLAQPRSSGHQLRHWQTIYLPPYARADAQAIFIVPWRFSDASWEHEDGFVMQASEKPAQERILI